jgi:hypothetical protein
MIHRVHHFRGIIAGLLVVAALGGLPGALRAETLFFRNDTKVALVVQGTCVIKGKVFNDRPNLLKPGDKCKIVLPGDKIITVREGKAPNNIIHRATIAAAVKDQYILLIPNPLMKNKLKLDPTDKKTYDKKP